jgi:hypothetical protein
MILELTTSERAGKVMIFLLVEAVELVGDKKLNKNK